LRELAELRARTHAEQKNDEYIHEMACFVKHGMDGWSLGATFQRSARIDVYD
jgi:hypothetical protein